MSYIIYVIIITILVLLLFPYSAYNNLACYTCEVQPDGICTNLVTKKPYWSKCSPYINDAQCVTFEFNRQIPSEDIVEWFQEDINKRVFKTCVKGTTCDKWFPKEDTKKYLRSINVFLNECVSCKEPFCNGPVHGTAESLSVNVSAVILNILFVLYQLL
ncbi:hypothetical protein ILUMI_15881 [Ignelater luminosus]|uniref:Uncharacterized protein n=1 Tax=Ignelater luminosus TaxID=2038154 RepID=A0A8K0G6G4_IGNLU|nr:hypothetical protein ILUMI_15881 [Ignelater luminosus]